MTCPDCQAAESDPRHDGYSDGCRACAARALVPAFCEASRSGAKFGEYRVALAALGLTHEEVKAAAMKLKGVT